MASDDTTPRRGAATRALAVAVLAGAGLLGPALPAAAAGSSTDLSVKVSNAVDAKPGKRVSYLVVVHNNGPRTARRVQIDFTTTAAMKSIHYKIANGHCYRSPKETACVFYSNLKSGASAAVTISGVISKKLAKGTPVTNRVKLASSTRLSHTADDVATDNYRVGIPRVVAAPAPTPSANPVSKLAKINDAASKVIGYSHTALTYTFIVLAAAFVWFVIGLRMRHRQRSLEEWEDDAEPADA